MKKIIILLFALSIIIASCGPTPEEYNQRKTDVSVKNTTTTRQMTAETISGSLCETISKTNTHIFFRCFDREYSNVCYVTGDNLFCLHMGD